VRLARGGLSATVDAVKAPKK
jgi:hypothetical protein